MTPNETLVPKRPETSGSNKAALFYAPGYLEYDFGYGHPFRSRRLVATLDLMRRAQLIMPDDVLSPSPVELSTLTLVHSPQYVEKVESLAYTLDPLPDVQLFGINTQDNPAFPLMHRAAALITGGTVQAANQVMRGELAHAFNVGGGLHHALPDRASGFCVYNDIAVAIAVLRRDYNARVAYVDLDVHHGDGVQWIFYDDPNVLTISLHQRSPGFYPGTGGTHELGSDAGEGYSINVPFEPYTNDASWLECFELVVPAALRAFKPDIIITQHGCDAHFADPLAHLNLTTRSYEFSAQTLHLLAHELCGGRWVALGGGGYNHFEVVPRTWTTVWSVLSHSQLPEALPNDWLEVWQPEANRVLTPTFLDQAGAAPRRPDAAAIAARNRARAESVLAAALKHIRAPRV